MNYRISEKGIVLSCIWSAEEQLDIQRTLDEWKTFRYHNIVLIDAEGKSVQTNGSNDPHIVLQGLDLFGFPHDFTGKTVLDIGCNLGFYSLAALARGAVKVVGIDVSCEYIQEASYVRDLLGISSEMLEFRALDGHQLADEGEVFDIVINLGVLYHIENPMLFLRETAKVTGEMMILESEMLVDPTFTEYAWFIEKEYGNDPTNWWIYGPSCLEGMARAAGYQEVKFEGFLWTPEPDAKTPEGFKRQGRGVLTCVI